MANDELLKARIEALLFASGDPLSAAKLAHILETSEEHVTVLLSELRQEMEQVSRGLTIVPLAGGYQLCTKPALAGVVEKLAYVQESKLSLAALETLAIVAFKQPVTRQEIESIRGVKAEKVIATLLERKLIKEIGRKDAIGRPILYGTTEKFLKCFGLKSIDDLPNLGDVFAEQSS